MTCRQGIGQGFLHSHLTSLGDIKLVSIRSLARQKSIEIPTFEITSLSVKQILWVGLSLAALIS